MVDPEISFEPFMDDGVRQFIVNGLDNFNIATTGLPTYFPANFVLRAPSGEVLGGLLGQIWGGWLQVSYLWVSEVVRGQGHGAGLLAAAEAYAKERGCIGATLETHSFQARPFYEQRGYKVFGTIEDYPGGHAKFFLEKRPL
jgi:GNAT superfamily N-acetyltransferase